MTKSFMLLAFLAAFFCPALAVAGANNATLNCVSTAGNGERLRLAGSIPGDFGSFSISLDSSSSSLVMSDSSHSISIIDDFKNKMFTLTVTGKDQSILILYGLPKTMTHKSGPGGSMDATFAAVLRKTWTSGYEDVSPSIPFSCAYHYSI